MCGLRDRRQPTIQESSDVSTSVWEAFRCPCICNKTRGLLTLTNHFMPHTQTSRPNAFPSNIARAVSICRTTPLAHQKCRHQCYLLPSLFVTNKWQNLRQSTRSFRFNVCKVIHVINRVLDTRAKGCVVFVDHGLPNTGLPPGHT